MKKSRIKSTIKNSIIGILAYGIKILLSFVVRTYFIKLLGVQYLGINGLFSNILSILALSDLGIYTVMVYSLYKPLSENNEQQISYLVKYFQKLYNIIAIIVLVIGISLIPILPHLIKNTELQISEITIYYMLLLLDSVSSYFVISRATILRADQKVYIIKIINSVSLILMYIFQIVFLLVFKKYLFYLICQVLFTLINNIIISIITKKMYPYLKQKNNNGNFNDIKIKIIKNLKSSFLYKIGSKVMASTDNILISLIIGTTMVGYYSNYVAVFSIINALIMIIIESMLGSIGNFIATESDERKYTMFRVLCYLFYFLASFCAACYIAGMNDFIRIWIGNEFVLSGVFIYCLALYRYVFCLIHPLWMVRESSGLFIHTKYVMIIAAVLNILLSFALGKLMGISGIILATAISYLTTVYIYEPYQLMKNLFKKRVKEYWKLTIKLLLISVPTLGVGVVLEKFNSTNLIVLCFKFVICFIVSISSYYIFMKKSEELSIIKNRIKSMLKRKKGMNKNEYI